MFLNSKIAHRLFFVNPLFGKRICLKEDWLLLKIYMEKQP